MNYTVEDLAALQSSVFSMDQPQMQQQGLQHGLQAGQQQPTNIGSAGGHHQQLSGLSVLQPSLQEALLAANWGGGDTRSSRLYSSSGPGVLGTPAYTRFNLHPQPLSQQQAAHQHGHQAVVGHHGTQAGQHFGHSMSSYNSCPLDVGSVLRAQLAAGASGGTPHPGLPQNLPRRLSTGLVTGPGLEALNSSQQPQGFDPTVRRPDFGEAPSAITGTQLVEPFMFPQVPDLQVPDLHGPTRRFPPGFRTSRLSPY